MVIWALHLVISYALASLDCYWHLFPFIIFGFDGIRILLLGLTLLAAIGMIAAGVVAYRNWKALQYGDGDRRPEHDPTGCYRFMMISGTLLSGLFLLGLIWTTFVIFISEHCP
jgi:hypothetical protein